jgi:outer membrane protein assembly factor BamD
MNLKNYILLFFSIIFLFSCKGKLEKLKATGDAKAIYKAAITAFDKQKYADAQDLFEAILNNYRGKEEAENLYFKYAYTHYYLKNFLLSNYYFKNFATTFPNSKMKEEAEFMSAYSHYHLSPTFRLDQTYTEKAIDELQNFINSYPNSKRVDESNKLIDEMRKKLEIKAFEQGRLYHDMKQYEASITSLENMQKEFPESTEVEKIRYYIIKSKYEWALNSVLEKKEDRLSTTIASCTEFLNKFPKSKYIKEINSIDKIANTKLKDLKNERHQVKSTGIRP